MHILPCTLSDLDEWVPLRRALWPDEEALDVSAEAMITWNSANMLALLARSDAGEALGFAEASLRHDYVNGCETSPVAFLEGIYVIPDARQHGVARALAAHVADWGRTHGCTEFASDALLDNLDSHAFHAAIGFEETERTVWFRKAL